MIEKIILDGSNKKNDHYNSIKKIFILKNKRYN